MAGDWIKMGCDLAEDPAVIAIAAKVGMDEIHVVGCLHAIWSWADRQSRDGHATGVTHAFLDRKARRDGFAQAMAEVGWLEITPVGVVFPNFGRHNGKTAKERALSNKRQKSHRENVTETVTPESRQPSRIERDNTVTREEKRREEEKTSASAPVGWIPADAWQAFAAHRKAKRAKLTPRAIELLVAKLDDYRKLGVEPRVVLEFAIESGHTGLYYRAASRQAPAAPNGATKAWKDLREAIASGTPHDWPAPVKAGLDAIGGWGWAKFAESRQLDFKQRDFEAAYNAAAH